MPTLDAIPPTALAADGVRVVLGGTEILGGADLEVRRGEVHVLIGPNGAGKTTLANAITGHVPLAGGGIRLGDRPLGGAPARRARAGLGRKFQVPRVFPRLTVDQHLAVAARRGTSRRSGARPADDATGGSPSLIGDLPRDRPVETLSHGQRQRLELQMVLDQQPEVVVLDEPAAGMTRRERDELAAAIRELAGARTFLVVEHDMDFVAAVADRVSFMRDGIVRRTGSFDELAADPEVRAAYLGTGAAIAPRARRTGSGGGERRGALAVRGLTVRHGHVEAVRDIELDLAPGEALGVLGRNGAGKTTLLEGLAGSLPARGTLELDGEDLSDRPAWDRAAAGIALVAQGRRLFRDLTVADNLLLAQTGPAGPGRTFDVHDLFPALAGLLERPAGVLSGGEQQQVAIAQALLRRPVLLLLDEPTEGISPIVTEQIVAVLRRLADDGLSLVLADQHRALVEPLCDRFVALRAGDAAGAGPITPAALDAYDERL